MSNIYVVGFPKSGNTWLVRLLARVLNAEVEKYAMKGTTPDIAADVNGEIIIASKYKISKVHFTLEKFFKTYTLNKDDRIVYIKRNILDVLISSFFYFIYRKDEIYILKKPPVKIILNPFKLYKYAKNRRFFSTYIKDFCTKGNKNHGKWQDHITLWEKFLKQNKDIKSTITSYEDLLSNTKNELSRILEKTHFENIDKRTIEEAVDKESFVKRKQNILSTTQELTFGKDYNLRFLRKGTPGDYNRFLNTRQISYINSFLQGASN